MAAALRLPLPHETLHPASGELMTDLNLPTRRGYELTIANRLWGQSGFPLRQEFLDITGEHYGAELGLVDFEHATEAARQSINQWVEQQTHQRIQDLIPDGSLSRDTRLVLTNAIYFLGDWEQKFNSLHTRNDQFTISPTEQMDVLMMNQEEDFRYAELPQAQVLELPYVGDDVSMLLMLPTDADGLDGLEDWLSAESLGAAMDSLQTERVRISLPKFTMTAEFDLNESLQDLGMQTAFTDFAYFSGISDVPLLISKVRHKSFLHVDEEGTEAAAATSVEIGLTSVPPEPVIFRADHPFLLALRDNRTESLLFLGRVVRPETDIAAAAIRTGDYNGDGRIDQGDLDLVLLHWGADAATPPAGWTSELPAVVVDQNELDAVLTNWGQSTAGLQAANVPEPAAWLLLSTAAACVAAISARTVAARCQRAGS
jgi:serpin B